MNLNITNPKLYRTEAEVAHALAAAASVVKLITGTANNAAWLVMMHAHDQIRKHPKYKHETKRAYKAAIRAWHDYETALVTANTNRFFHVDDMAEHVRRKYGNITDAQYYEFWTSMGGTAYLQTKPMITSLWNKFRLSLLQHNVKHAEKVAWVMTALSCLELAVKMYESALRTVRENSGLPPSLINSIFACFSLRHISALWRKALDMTEDITYDIDEVEERNIELGVRQLQDAWTNGHLLYDSVRQSITDYDDVFRNKMEMRMALAEINTIENETVI